MSTERNILDLWLGGRVAGQLMRAESGEVEFSYHDDYRSDPTNCPLSTTMPKSHAGFSPTRVMPWLSNLLPDAVEVRDRWAAKFGETNNDPFTLLRHVGEDAPGAVQVVPEGSIPSQLSELSPISDQQIAARVRGIFDDPDHWVDDSIDDKSRFSLGGNQGKFALSLIDGKWHEPNGRAASTHIVKPGMMTVTGKTNSEVQAIEFVTMRAARYLNIPAAHVSIEDFDGLLAFVTKRYDRLASGTGVLRLHQEDFCQALNVLPARKYEEDGGPSMADMLHLVTRLSSLSYREHDRRLLTSLFVFNLLAAGVDAHSKNHSLLLFGDQVRLAPAYDLISAHGLWTEDRVRFKSSAAVRYGKERRYRNITGRNLARTADVLGADRQEFAELLSSMAAALPEAFENAIAELPLEMMTDAVKRIPARAGRFASPLSRRVRSKETVDTPPFIAAPTTLPSEVSDSVWVKGHWSNDTWLTGHNTRRGGRH